LINLFKNKRELKGFDLNTQAGRDQFVKLLGTKDLEEPKAIRKHIDHLIKHDRQYDGFNPSGRGPWVVWNYPLIGRCTRLTTQLMAFTGPIIKNRK
jgi:hypothetical protein